MNNKVTEINVIPVKAQDGLIAFCSFVLFELLYCGSVAVYTRKDGGYRLVYPNKKVGLKEQNIFHPINQEIGSEIEEAVSEKVNEIMYHD